MNRQLFLLPVWIVESTFAARVGGSAPLRPPGSAKILYRVSLFCHKGRAAALYLRFPYDPSLLPSGSINIPL
jgi:hypothetical protein